MMRQLAGTPRAAKRSEARNFARVKRELALVTRERDFTPAGGVLCEVILMKYRAIQANDRRLPIRLMCHTLPPAGYYARGKPGRGDRSVHNRTALSDIQVLHREVPGDLRQPSIWKALVLRPVHLVGTHRMIQPNVKRRIVLSLGME